MKHAKLRVVIAALCVSCLSGLALADSTVIVSSRDNTLYQDPEGDLSNGAGNGMFAGRNGSPSNSIRRGLVWFDVAGQVPAGSTITSVTLSLYNSAANAAESMVSLNRALESWGEGTSVASSGGGGGGAAATPGDATWLYRFFPGTPWASPGGTFNPAASAVTGVADSGPYDWSSAGLVADIQSFLDSPATNFGWIIIGDESTSSTAKRFATREETLADRRPMLMVDYTPVPAPAGSVALVLAGFAAMRRKRA